MKTRLQLLAVEHEPYGTFIVMPTQWPDLALDVFDEELTEPFGHVEYWQKKQGVFFKEWDACAIIEEITGVLRDAGIDATISATILDFDNQSFYRRMTVTKDSDGFELVEIEPSDITPVSCKPTTRKSEGNT